MTNYERGLRVTLLDRMKQCGPWNEHPSPSVRHLCDSVSSSVKGGPWWHHVGGDSTSSQCRLLRFCFPFHRVTTACVGVWAWGEGGACLHSPA